MLLSHTSQLSAPSTANGCSQCLPFLFCLLSSVIKKSCSLTVIVVPASAVVENRPRQCLGISRHWETQSLVIQVPLGYISAFFKRELLPACQEIPMRAGLRARASTCGMEGKPSECDFTHRACSPRELWSVGVMLREDFWVVPSWVFHLHPLEPEEVRDLQVQPRPQQQHEESRRCRSASRSRFRLNIAFDAWVRRDSYWCAWKMTIKMHFYKRVWKSRPVFVQLSQGHAGSSRGVSSREITAESQSSIFSIPHWSPRGGRRVPHASMDIIPLVFLAPSCSSTPLAARSCWRSPGIKELPAPHLQLCNYLFGWQELGPFSRAQDWSVPHSSVQHHVLPNCSISVGLCLNKSQKVVGGLESAEKKATKLI